MSLTPFTTAPMMMGIIAVLRLGVLPVLSLVMSLQSPPPTTVGLVETCGSTHSQFLNRVVYDVSADPPVSTRYFLTPQAVHDASVVCLVSTPYLPTPQSDASEGPTVSTRYLSVPQSVKRCFSGLSCSNPVLARVTDRTRWFMYCWTPVQGSTDGIKITTWDKHSTGLPRLHTSDDKTWQKVLPITSDVEKFGTCLTDRVLELLTHGFGFICMSSSSVDDKFRPEEVVEVVINSNQKTIFRLFEIPFLLPLLLLLLLLLLLRPLLFTLNCEFEVLRRSWEVRQRRTPTVTI